MFQIENFCNFLNCKSLEYSKSQIFWNFPNCKFFKVRTFAIFRIYRIENFFGIFQTANNWNFPNCQFLKFEKLNIFGIYQIQTFEIENFCTFPNSKFLNIFVISQTANF